MAAGTNPFVPQAPPIQDPMASYARLVQLRTALQQQQLMQGQQQLQGQDIQRGQLQLNDQQAMTQAMHQWDGQDVNELPVLILKNGGSANAVFGMKNTVLSYQKNLQAMTKDQLANEAAKNDVIAEHIDNVKSLPAAQQPQAFEDAKADLVKRGYLDPQSAQGMSYQGPEQLDTLEKFYMGHTAAVGAAQKTAQAARDTAEANKTNTQMQWYQQHGGLPPGITPDTASYAAYIQNGGQPQNYVGFKARQTAAAELPYQVAKETNPAVINARVGQAVRTEVGKEQALAPQLQQITNTTRSGRQYISRDDIPQGSAGVVEQQAAQAGIPVVSKDTAGTLEDIDTAKANQQYMLDSIGKKLATDPTGRLYSAPANTIAKLAQTDPQLAAMGTFRNAAIQSMRAVAGSKGLRINQYEVQLAIDNDIPKMTDTLPVAQQKLKNLQAFLGNAEQSHLVRNRAVTAPTAGGWGEQFGGVRRSQ